MENSLKQRIVGAVVLIALAVIFLPAILKEKEQQEPFISKIPAKPIESMPIEMPEEVIEKNNKVQQSLDQLENQERKQKLNETKATQDDTKDTAEAKTETAVKKEIVDQDSVNEPVKEPSETIGPDFEDAAWIIQIASFSNKDNAVSFVEKLKTAGHKTYRQDIMNDQKKMIYRVYTGPYIRKEDAEKALKAVNETSKLSGIIMLFDPTKQ